MPEIASVDDGGGRRRAIQVDYPSNSKSPKKEDEQPKVKKVETVVTGEVVRRKRSPFAKFVHGFIAEDSGSIFEYIIQEVLLPAAKTTISDVVTQGLDRMFYGGSRPKNSAGRQGYVNYSSRASSSKVNNITTLSQRQRANHDFADIIIGSRGEAEDVLDQLRHLIEDYGLATVSDFYELVGLSGEFTDNKWGWFDLKSAAIRPVRGGYIFHLPRTENVS